MGVDSVQGNQIGGLRKPTFWVHFGVVWYKEIRDQRPNFWTDPVGEIHYFLLWERCCTSPGFQWRAQVDAISPSLLWWLADMRPKLGTKTWIIWAGSKTQTRQRPTWNSRVWLENEEKFRCREVFTQGNMGHSDLRDPRSLSPFKSGSS